MLRKVIKNKLLPKDASGWVKYNDKLRNDISANNLISQATRVLVSFMFGSNPKDQLETTLIHKLSKYTDDTVELMIIVFKTAKIYGSCIHDKYLLNGLYNAGIDFNVIMKYTPADYFYDDNSNTLVLDVGGNLKSKYKAQVHKHIISLLNSNPQKDEFPDTTNKNVKLDKNTEANKLIDEWIEKNKGKTNASN